MGCHICFWLHQIRAANFIHLDSKIVTLGSNFVIFLGSKNFFLGSEIISLSSKIIYLGSKFPRQQILQGLAAIFVEMSGKYF
jgi:hypothetical protein